MEDRRLRGNISLIGFDKLEPVEIATAEKLIVTYIKRLDENKEFKDLKLVLKQHQHGKTFKHEINAHATFSNQKLLSNVVEWNLFKAISKAIEKIISESAHKNKRELLRAKNIRKGKFE